MSDDDTPPVSPGASPPTRRGRKGPDRELIARMTALGAQAGHAPPAEPVDRATRPARRTKPVTTTSAETDAAAPAAPAPREEPARKAPERKAPARKPAAMPPEQPRAVTYSERINLTTTPEQNRALNLARVEDGIDKTARLRAMIALWQQDERIRKRIDKLAREWR